MGRAFSSRADLLRGAALLAALRGSPVPAAIDGPRAVVLEVVAPADRRDVWPRPFGVVVPKGLCRRGERLALFDRDGSERPARVMSWVADGAGEPRLVRVEPGELPPDRRRLELRSTALAPPPPWLRCERDYGRVRFTATADDGAVEWRDGVLSAQAGAARLELDFAKLGLSDDGDERRPSRVPAARLVGPDGGGAELDVTLPFAAADEVGISGQVDLVVAVAPSAKAAALELVFVAPRDLVVRRLTLRGRAHGARADLLRGRTRVAAAADGVRRSVESGLVGGRRGEPVEAAVAPLALVVGEGRSRVELSWPDFGLARPSGTTLRRDGSFALDLVAEPLLMHAGQTLCRTLALARGDRVGRDLARPFVVAREQVGLLDEATRAWLAPWRDFLHRWLARPQRLDDRGCYLEPWGDLANGEYDLGGSLLWLGAVERDPVWLSCGEIVARHTLEWDRGAPPPDLPAGLFSCHGEDHASGKFEAGHQWVGGALALARTAGSLAALDAAHALAAGLAQWRAHPGSFHGPERRLAWPLRVAAEMEATLDAPGARELGRSLLKELLARQASFGGLDGDRRDTRDGARLWINSWVSLGITVESLARAEDAFPGEGALESAVRLARFVVDEGLSPAGLAEVLLVDPEIEVVVERRAICRGGDAAFAAAGVRWIAGVAQDERLARAADELDHQARRDLAVPDDERLVELAKALLALQSFSAPSSLRTGRPRTNR